MPTSEEFKLTLHWLNGSRAQGTLWLLQELQIPFDIKVYQRKASSIFAPAELENVHPMGKSPTITITTPGSSQPILLAESAFIAQYLSDHFNKGKVILPKRWKDGQEGKIGGETEEWMRCQYILYYSDASLMSTIYLGLILSGLKGNDIPFFIRPITKTVANEFINLFVLPNLKKHFALLESYLITSPNGGKYICGQHLTVADIILAYPLIAAKGASMTELAKGDRKTFQEAFPKVEAYIQMLSEEPGYKASIKKIVDITGTFKPMP
ncbi:hypothetical protein BGZ63DRAFT_426172 [Mariannaea sp. PMI_226]|nr:hypothetical protein BGZ63DRAFT_426172 [Mariannaea sp. PMI_226]